jgi:hypothetical protein
MSASPSEAMTVDAPPRLVLEHVFDYEAHLDAPVPIGRGLGGNRVFWPALGGTVRGPRIRGEVLPGGGDWALTTGDGWTGLDVRGQCRTDDGAHLYIRYRGLLEPSPAVAHAMATGGATRFEDQYFRITPTVETGDERYAWLTRSVLVGRGRICSSPDGPGVAYEVFRVA